MNRFHYDEDQRQYVSAKFYNYQRYWENVLEDESTDNWEMYNGWDSYIRKRKSENRSSLQLPILYPAIEGRVSHILNRWKSREPLVRIRARDRTQPMPVLSALKIQQWIRQILERQNWQEEIGIMMMAAEVFPIVWVKTRIGEMAMTPSEQRTLEEIWGVAPGTFNGGTRMVPEFEVLPPSCVFYDFRAKRQGDFIEKFHVKMVSIDEIYTRFGSNIVRKVENYESKEPQWVKDWEEAAGFDYLEGGEARYRLAEGWINAQYSDGRVERRVVRFLPDVNTDVGSDQTLGLLLEDDPAPITFDPFHPVVSRRLPFHLLGKSTVALGKAFQREAAELTNMAIDILGFTAAPPIMMEKGAVDNPSLLEFTARSLWLLNDTTFPPQPLHVPAPNAPFLQAVRTQVENDLNHITAAYEGITGQPDVSGGDETLGQFRTRTAVGQGRLELPFIGYANVISKIVEKYWLYMREYPRTLLGRSPLPVQTPMGPMHVNVQDLDVDANIEIPNLTEYENEEIAKIEADRAIERAAAMPIIALNPAAQQVLMAIYFRRHITDPADYQSFLMSLQQPLQPELAASNNGRGMPMTQFSPGVGNIERNQSLIGASEAGGR